MRISVISLLTTKTIVFLCCGIVRWKVNGVQLFVSLSLLIITWSLFCANKFGMVYIYFLASCLSEMVFFLSAANSHYTLEPCQASPVQDTQSAYNKKNRIEPYFSVSFHPKYYKSSKILGESSPKSFLSINFFYRDNHKYRFFVVVYINMQISLSLNKKTSSRIWCRNLPSVIYFYFSNFFRLKKHAVLIFSPLWILYSQSPTTNIQPRLLILNQV